MSRLIDGKMDYELENRQTEEAYEMDVRRGYQLIMGSLCGFWSGGNCQCICQYPGRTLHENGNLHGICQWESHRGTGADIGHEACIVGIRPILASIPVNIDGHTHGPAEPVYVL